MERKLNKNKTIVVKAKESITKTKRNSSHDPETLEELKLMEENY